MRKQLVAPVLLAAVLAGGATQIVQDQCGPFTDVTPGFCPYILEIYYLGITVGTSATTFSPDDPLTRGQGAVFVAKGINQTLARSSRRAALGQWWTTTPHWDLDLGTTLVGTQPLGVSFDGADLWTANQSSASVSRVRASDGKLLETWTGVVVPQTTMPALGRIFVLTGGLDGGSLYAIDPSQPPGDATLVADIGNGARSMASDGGRIFVTNGGGIAHDVYLSIVTPGPTLPWTVQKIHDPLYNGTLAFDGSSMWVAGAGVLLRLDADGSVLQSVPLSSGFLGWSAFDGENLWVPDLADGSVHVVRAASGEVVTTLSGNGLSQAVWAAFDGQRVLVTDPNIGNVIALWRAADLTPIGSFPAPTNGTPFGVCSDGANFWVTLAGLSRLVRF